jgi:hypothetical protein
LMISSAAAARTGGGCLHRHGLRRHARWAEVGISA